MDFSLDDLLDEMEGAMKGEHPLKSSAPADPLRATLVMDWSQSSPLKKPPDMYEPRKPASAWAGSTPHGELAFHQTPQGAIFLGAAPDTPGGADDGDVDELLRVVSVVREGNVDASYGGEKSEARADLGAGVAGATPPAVVLREISSTPSTQSKDSSSGLSVSGAKRRRCGTVCLAGTSTQRGFCASSLSRCACDSLRCTDCNFEVLCFLGRAWDAETDYMFFRNNAPDPTKLSARLTSSSDGCAYACQCSWKNVKELCLLSPTERPRWACGGH